MPESSEAARPTGGGRDVYTVSRLNGAVRALLDDGFPLLWVEGEVSNFSRPASGHWYLTLKDAAAQVRCAMFRQRNQSLRVVPREGMHVLVRARVSLYEPRGDYQLILEYLEEAGEGELRRRLEQLKQRLAAEGLFDAGRKRPLPRLPRRIGVVTSPTGAALRDILKVLRRRFPAVPVLLYPVPVQGAGAAQQIAEAIALASARREVDVLIVTRGGGSLEDLWAFNEEPVARAIHGCSIPVVSAVGHEVDVTVADLVADLRAPTPSAAAEVVVPDREEWLRGSANALARLLGAMRRALAERNESLDWGVKRLQQLHPAARMAQRVQRVDELEQRLAAALRRDLSERGHRLAARRADLARRSPSAELAALGQRSALLAARLAGAARARLAQARGRGELAVRALHTVSPLATLARGYAIVRIVDGPIVTEAEQAPPGTDIEARLAHGALRARVTGSRD